MVTSWERHLESYKLIIPKLLQTSNGRLSKGHSFSKHNSLTVLKVQVFKTDMF